MPETAPKALVVAINPEASFGRGKGIGPIVMKSLREAGFEVQECIESNFEKLVSSTSAALKSTRAKGLVVVGGDGMVNLGVNLVAGTDIPLGIVPSGTGNDMARGLGIPVSDTLGAIALLLRALDGEPRVVDAGQMTSADGSRRWFACVFSAGFDAIVNERANLMHWPKGRQRYNLALLRELALLKPISYNLEVDGKKEEARAVLVAVANNASFGGGMKITPDALLDDGQLDLFVVQPLSRTAFLRIFPSVFKGTHVRDPRVSIRRASKVKVSAPDIVAYADGERVSELPIEVEIVPGSLRVLAPE